MFSVGHSKHFIELSCKDIVSTLAFLNQSSGLKSSFTFFFFPIVGRSPQRSLKIWLLFAHPFLWLVYGNMGTFRFRVISPQQFTGLLMVIVTGFSWPHQNILVAVTVSVTGFWDEMQRMLSIGPFFQHFMFHLRRCQAKHWVDAGR